MTFPIGIAPPASEEQTQPQGAVAVTADLANVPPEPLVQCAHLADVPLKVEALLDCLTMDLGAVAALEVGSLILLNRSAGDNVDLCVNGVPLASGEIMAIENTTSVQITDFVHAEVSAPTEP